MISLDIIIGILETKDFSIFVLVFACLFSLTMLLLGYFLNKKEGAQYRLLVKNQEELLRLFRRGQKYAPAQLQNKIYADYKKRKNVVPFEKDELATFIESQSFLARLTDDLICLESKGKLRSFFDTQTSGTCIPLEIFDGELKNSEIFWGLV